MAEGGTIGATATLANVVANALTPLGIKVTELPLSPQRIVALVEAAAAHAPLLPEATALPARRP